MAPPDRCVNVSFQESFTLPVFGSTVVTPKLPVAPEGTPVGFGTSAPAESFALKAYVSFCAEAVASPVTTNATTKPQRLS